MGDHGAGLKEALQHVQLPESDRAALAHAIFESKEWPVKLVVRPLLEADGVPGAMPSGKGIGWNPFTRDRDLGEFKGA